MGFGQRTKKSESCTTVTLDYNGEEKQVVLFEGISGDELQNVLKATFNISDEIVGVKEVKFDMHFPLSLMSRDPTYFGSSKPGSCNSSYTLILDYETLWKHGRVRTTLPPKMPAPSNEASQNRERLSSVSNVFHLNDVEMTELLEAFRESSVDGALDQETFQKLFKDIIGTSNDAARTDFILNRLFGIFDRDGSQRVNTAEFIAGLEELAGGERDHKARAAFAKFDSDGDGFITEDQMTIFLATVFTAVQHLIPDQYSREVTAPPLHLARVTARQCFLEADLDRNGQLGFQEFRLWYTSGEGVKMDELLMSYESSPQAYKAPPPTTDPTPTAPSLASIFSNTAAAAAASPSPNPAPTPAPTPAPVSRGGGYVPSPGPSPRPTLSLSEVREVTGLAQCSADQVFELFAADAQTGVVTRASYFRCFNQLMAARRADLEQTQPLTQPQTQARANHPHVITLLQRLFSLFDVEGSGSVDFAELASGLSVLCGGGVEERMRAVFALYTIDDDEVISQDDLTTYLSSLFKVLYVTSPDARLKMNLSPPQLGHVTAHEIFTRARGNRTLTPEGLLPLDEFRSWYDREGGALFLPAGSETLGNCGGGGYEPQPRRRSTISGPVDKEMSRLEQLQQQLGGGGVGVKQQQQQQQQPPPPQQQGPGGGQAGGRPHQSGLFDRDEIHRLTGIKSLTVDHVFRLFYQASDLMGKLARPDFVRVFRVLSENGGQGWRLSRADQAQRDELISWLFDVFDTDQDGTIDFAELASGLSVLCGGGRDEKVRAAFSLYDVNGDGFISREEMVAYLTSVFRVLYETSPGTRERMNVSAEELGGLTAAQAFEEADLNNDGKLSFEEFKRFYSQLPSSSGDHVDRVGAAATAAAAAAADAAPGIRGGGGSTTAATAAAAAAAARSSATATQSPASSQTPKVPPSLQELRRMTNLPAYNVNNVFDFFATAASAQGTLDCVQFFRCFRKLIKAAAGPDGLSPERKKRAKSVVAQLFDLFAGSKAGSVDFAELASGLSVLCGGGRDEKVRAAFSLYDVNGDGFISREEMLIYLTSMYRVLGLAGHMTSNSSELALVTVQECFEETGIESNRISFDQFKDWYSQAAGLSSNASPAAPAPAPAAAPAPAPAQAQAPTSPPAAPFTMVEARTLTGLAHCDVTTVFDLFASAASSSGTLSRSSFDACFRQLMRATGAGVGADGRVCEATEARGHEVASRLFDMFDADHNGELDFAELGSGLSVLCGGDSDERVRAAFALYDVDSTGHISLEEMTSYLTSVFKVLYETHPGTAERMGVPAPTLAAATASQAFAEADVNKDGRLSFEEFQLWYSNPDHHNLTHVVEEVEAEEPPLSMEEVEELTALRQHNVQDVFELFASESSEEGTLDELAFVRCFHELTCRLSDATGRVMSREEEVRAHRVVVRLFNLFDENGDGAIDFAELASGLSVLCGGGRDEKVRAAFSLYDVNGDGFISREEMVTYLTSVFRVVYETSPR